MARVLTLTLIIAGLIYAGLGAALFYFQRSLIFVADKTDVAPADVGLSRAEAHRLTTADGVDLVSWLMPGRGPYIAIYFHGNGGALASRAERITELNDLGLSVLALEYRGFGGSGGSPSETGFSADADATYDVARKLGYAPAHVLLYGESLGSGVAVALAARREVAGVILDAAYSSIADVAADRYWMFPVRLLLRDPFRSDREVGRIKAPVLMLHGDADDVVPIRYGRRLFALAGPRASFVTIKGAGHVVFSEDEAQAQVRRWLAQFPQTESEE